MSTILRLVLGPWPRADGGRIMEVEGTAMQRGQVIRILGPIDVETPDAVVKIGSLHARALLGVLVISAGRAVPIAYLHEVLWGAEPPRTAANTLQSYISQLRGILGAEAIISEDHSYVLDVGADEIDALRFERLVAGALTPGAEAEHRRDACRTALAMWRGRPFGELADDEAFRLDAYRLDELRVTAMETAIAAELELGRHDLVVGELETFVEEHPYRERAWYLLIEALTRAGRRIEAAHSCGRLREQLAEAGVAAGSELDALERRLADDVLS